MTAITTSHIVLDGRGTAFVEGTRTRVAMIVMDKMNGMTPEQIYAAYPYLALSQIYAALAYYYDHQTTLDAEIARECKETPALREAAIAAGATPRREQLEARKNERERRP